MVEAEDVTVRGLTVRHASPSVASNYAVLVSAGGTLRMEECDVSSSTGSGVGCEGGRVDATRCAFRGCHLHGAILVGDLMGDAAAGASRLETCELVGNGGCGVVVRGGAAALLAGCTIEDNGERGVFASGAALEMLGNTVARNRRGDVQTELMLAFSESEDVFKDVTRRSAAPVL